MSSLRDVNDDSLPEVPTYEEIAKRVDSTEEKWKIRYDKCHKSPSKYEENDMVLVESVVTSNGESRKLEPKYRVPYIVSKVLDKDRYLICDLPDIQRNQRPYQSVFSSDKMKPWCRLGPEAYDEDEEIGRDDQM